MSPSHAWTGPTTIKGCEDWAALEKEMSLEDVRNALLIAYDDSFLDDEEFIILYDYYQHVNPAFPYWNFDPFCLDVFDFCECEAHFRVANDDIPILLNALRIPAVFTSFSLSLIAHRLFNIKVTFKKQKW